MITTATPDKITKRWMRDASDELAVSNGCWFDERRGEWVVDWLRDYLRLYEGESAGQRFECLDWQLDATMRLFGWVRDSEDWGKNVRRFRRASIWTGKKNKKSPTLAAWCVYMFAGDNVHGQKCFPTAKNGTQVRQNVGRHIHEMIRQSEALMQECRINRVDGSVLHEPTRSLILPLSSENVQTQKAAEGLNGSIFVDETHVVDKQHMRRVSRAGISRPQPLQVEVSTAGDEPESYGMGRFKYAESVIAGNQKDDQTLCMIFAAPQDIKDEVIHADPEKYGKLANPSWGHTVKPGEFLHDYEMSKTRLADFADFKKYRLNIWQQSTSQWLSIHDWHACKSTDAHLDPDLETFAGLDLSRTTDFTAWVLYQPEIKKCWGHYWVPRERAEQLSGQYEIPIMDWAAQGWVTVTDASPIPRRKVHERFAEDCEKFRHLEYIGFDRALMSDSIEFLRDELGRTPKELAQGVMTLNSPSVALEELVCAGDLDHSNDPVLEWMLANTAVKPDSNGNIKPLKTDGGVRKHVDGIVALVMAICVSIENESSELSVYETPGMLTL